MSPWVLFGQTLLLLEAMVFLQGLLAWKDGFFSAAQMYRERGLKDGYSFLQHGGMWADVFVISPITAYVVTFTKVRFDTPESVIIFLLAAAAWTIMARGFKNLTVPEAHAHWGEITYAGIVHLIFAVVGTWVIVLFYLSHPTLVELVIVSALLTPFFFLGIVKFTTRWKWNPGAYAAVTLGPIAVWGFVLWYWLY